MSSAYDVGHQASGTTSAESSAESYWEDSEDLPPQRTQRVAASGGPPGRGSRLQESSSDDETSWSEDSEDSSDGVVRVHRPPPRAAVEASPESSGGVIRVHGPPPAAAVEESSDDWWLEESSDDSWLELSDDEPGVVVVHQMPRLEYPHQGVSARMEVLKRSAIAYFEAVRAKNDLRRELQVATLTKRFRSKARVADPRIAEVRQAKTAAKDQYLAAKKEVAAYLKSTPAPEVAAMLATVDAFVTTIGLSDKQGNFEVAQVAAAEEAAKVGVVIDKLVVSENNYAKLHASIADIVAAGVGSSDKSAGFSLTLGVGVPKLGKLDLSFGLKYSGSVNIQDDRKLRVTHGVTVSGGVSGEFGAVIKAAVAAEFTGASTEVFVGPEHWASVMAYRAAGISRAIAEFHADVGDTFSPGQADAWLSRRHLAGHETTNVESDTATAKLDASLLGVGGSFQRSGTDAEFTNPAGEKKKSTTKATSVAASMGNYGIAVTWTSIKDHANPDNDGDYRNIKLQMSAKVAAGLVAKGPDPVYSEWEDKIRDFFNAETVSDGGDSPVSAEQGLVEGAAESSDQGQYGDVVKKITEYLGAEALKLEVALDSLPEGLAVNFGAQKSGAIEWNWVKEDNGRMTLQYRRMSQSHGWKLSGTIPVGDVGGASLSVGFEGGKSRSVMANEKLGVETLSYFLTVFNGLSARDDLNQRDGDASEWEQYLTAHEESAWQAMCLVKKNKGAAAANVRELVAQASPARPRGASAEGWADTIRKHTAAKDAATALLRAVDQMRVGDSSEESVGWDAVRAAFTAYLRAQGVLDKAAIRHTWKAPAAVG